jgi:hypothetical protein
MHSAHRTVGVRGGGIAQRPYCRAESDLSDGQTALRRHVALAAHRRDADACAALGLFEQAISGRRDWRCRRVDLDAWDGELPDLAETDCLVVFGQGLHMAESWADVDDVLLDHDPTTGGDEPVQIEFAAAASWYPILEGVEPFRSRQNLSSGVRVPSGATILLTAATSCGSRPVAWIEHRHGRVFRTTLGSAADFRQPNFVRLVINATAWLAQ